MQQVLAIRSPQLQAQMADGQHNCKQVPPEVWDAIVTVIDACDPDMPTREQMTERIAAIMHADDWTFCSCYRHENTIQHAVVYRLLSTVGANIKAGELR